MSDTQIVSDLKKRDTAAYDLLYRFYYPTIERFVKRNSGTADDAKDVFQETIIVLLDKVPKEDFVLTSSIKTYIFAVASNIWLKRLRDARNLTKLSDDYDIEDMTFAAWEQREESKIKQNVVQRLLTKISRHCFHLLTQTFLTGTTREKLMKEMGYKNSHTFDNQKYKCLEQARKTSQS